RGRKIEVLPHPIASTTTPLFTQYIQSTAQLPICLMILLNVAELLMPSRPITGSKLRLPGSLEWTEELFKDGLTTPIHNIGQPSQEDNLDLLALEICNAF
ncbi:MAG: hypothetical protein M1837_001271, partial [Sclerophora amabilis]